MSQVASLYLRGSLVNKTARSLLPEQRIEVEHLMDLTWNADNLQNAKWEFCMALQRTIGAEYKNIETAMQEVWVTLWRCATDVLYHNPQNGPPRTDEWREHIVSDPIARKKYFQTYLFSYLKQILRENKIPRTVHQRTVTGTADVVAKEMVMAILAQAKESHNAKVKQTTNRLFIKTDTRVLPMRVITALSSIRGQLTRHGVEMVVSDSGIIVKCSGSMPMVSGEVAEYSYVRETSLDIGDGDESNGFRDHIESQLSHKEDKGMAAMIQTEAMKQLRQNLNPVAQAIFDVITNTPDEFKQRYGNGPVQKKHIASFLDIDEDEIEQAYKVIRLQTYAAGVV